METKIIKLTPDFLTVAPVTSVKDEAETINDWFGMDDIITMNPISYLENQRMESKALMGSELSSVPEKIEHQARVFEESLPVDK